MEILIMTGLQILAKRIGQPGPTAIRHIKFLVQGLLFALLVWQSNVSQAADRPTNEYRIKAAFLYNFSSFVSWPEKVTQHNDEFELCVVGNDPFGKALDTLSGKTVHGRSLKVRRLSDGVITDACQLVYISESETKRFVRLLGKVRARPVLTVSDIDDFATHGGIIRFRLDNNKVRFDINVDAAERAGLNISSKLLSLATIVREEKVTAR
jgi:hypothetical protein